MKYLIKLLLPALFSFLTASGSTLYAQNSPRIEKLYLSTDKDTYTIGDQIWFSGFLVNSYTLQKIRDGSQFIYVELLDERDSLITRVKVKQDSLGFHNTLKLPGKMPQGRYRLRGYTRWMMNFDTAYLFSKNIQVFNPVKKETETKRETGDDFDVQLFPESGVLLPGIWDNIAFKAIGSDGLSADVTLTITDSKGHEIIRTAPTHSGMGSFKVNVDQGETYTVVAEYKGKEKAIPFPEIEKSGVTAQCVFLKDQIICETTISADLDPMDYELILNCRGAEMYRCPLKRHSTITKFDKTYMPDGISSIIIFNKKAQIPAARRLVFINNGNMAVPQLETKKNREARAAVMTDIYLKDQEGQPLQGDFSISITDAGAVEPDTTGNNILSYLLMSSDLKGHIEDPRYYFKCKENEKDIDLLMLTQGWASYKNENEYVPQKLSYDFETDQVISGSVYGFWGNKAKSPIIMFAEPRSRIFEMIPLGENNSFNIHTDFPDSTIYFLQAHYKNGKIGNTLTLKMDPEEFAPLPARHSEVPRYVQPAEISADYEKQSMQSLAYSEEGAMFLELKGTTITAEREEDDLVSSVLNPTHVLAGDDLERFSGSSVFDAARTFPGVRGTDTLYIRGGQDPVLFFVDDMPVDYTDVQTLMTSNVKSIEMVNGEEAQFLTANGSGGIFVIQLKDGAELQSMEPLPSFAKIQYLGWKQPERFYQPKYDVDSIRNSSIPDLRTTIHWDPVVRTDQKGHAWIRYYNSDLPGKYRFTLEGITEDGRIIYADELMEK